LRLRALLVAGPAHQQLADILSESEDAFGAVARERYAALVTQAVEDLLDNPGRRGTRVLNGRIHYHLRHSRGRVPPEIGRVGSPRHLIIARVVDEELLILAFGRDGMMDELGRRMEKGEAEF
jgi:toxin ParE1/3/4